MPSLSHVPQLTQNIPPLWPPALPPIMQTVIEMPPPPRDTLSCDEGQALASHLPGCGGKWRAGRQQQKYNYQHHTDIFLAYKYTAPEG